MRRRSSKAWTVSLASLTFATACGDSGVDPPRNLVCDLPGELFSSSLPPDAIPALSDPVVVGPNDPGAAYLTDDARVLGVVVEGMARAYPHNILWHHEIVNDVVGEAAIAVTFCPLTGSGLAFDRVIDGRELDLGVSGLLFANNLVLYDRTTDEVYGPQLSVEGRCGVFRDTSLSLFPVQEMSWGRWKELYPETTVLSDDQGHIRNYGHYPYGDYDEITDNSLLFPMDADRTRAIKERVLAVRSGAGGVGFPFGALRDLGSSSAVHRTIGGVPTVVLYEEREGETAVAYRAQMGSTPLTFEPSGPGTWTDRETGSTWTLSGEAIEGALVGSRLEPRSNAYTLFWFAWRHFQPDGEIGLTP